MFVQGLVDFALLLLWESKGLIAQNRHKKQLRCYATDRKQVCFLLWRHIEKKCCYKTENTGRANFAMVLTCETILYPDSPFAFTIFHMYHMKQSTLTSTAVMGREQTTTSAQHGGGGVTSACGCQQIWVTGCKGGVQRADLYRTGLPVSISHKLLEPC